jgi:hypothetical protein
LTIWVESLSLKGLPGNAVAWVPQVTVNLSLPVEPVWFASPPYLAVIVYEPVADGVNLTVQLAVAPVPERVQVVEENEPAALLEKVTVPVGVTGVPGLVSVTVTLHLVAVPDLNGAVQTSVLVVVRLSAVTLKVPLLFVWSVSPG